jgi:hypothetical protein
MADHVCDECGTEFDEAESEFFHDDGESCICAFCNSELSDDTSDD